MSHLSEEQLILHYYGEEAADPETGRHLDECAACRESYGALQRTLNMMDSLQAPERDDAYGERVWRRIEDRLPLQNRWKRWSLPAWRWAAAATAVAGLVVAAFMMGRNYPRNAQPAPAVASVDARASERVLVAAVSDYLDRSQIMLIELSNAEPGKGGLDISAQQERASGLVSEARLYRQSASHNGDAALAGILDELERVLMDITHEPSRLSPGNVERLRERLKAEGILFKIRVLGSNLRREQAPATDGPQAL